MIKQCLDNLNLDIGDCLMIGIWKFGYFLGPVEVHEK